MTGPDVTTALDRLAGLHAAATPGPWVQHDSDGDYIIGDVGSDDDGEPTYLDVSSSGPVHTRARWARPDAYSASVADPPRWPRAVVLRSSCGHMLGVGIVWRRQRYLTWRRCSR